MCLGWASWVRVMPRRIRSWTTACLGTRSWSAPLRSPLPWNWGRESPTPRRVRVQSAPRMTSPVQHGPCGTCRQSSSSAALSLKSTASHTLSTRWVRICTSLRGSRWTILTMRWNMEMELQSNASICSLKCGRCWIGIVGSWGCFWPFPGLSLIQLGFKTSRKFYLQMMTCLRDSKCIYLCLKLVFLPILWQLRP